MASAIGLWILASVASVGAQVPREEPRLALEPLLEQMAEAKNRINIVILDGCRPCSLTFVKQEAPGSSR
jgi:hypothetical protein